MKNMKSAETSKIFEGIRLAKPLGKYAIRRLQEKNYTAAMDLPDRPRIKEDRETRAANSARVMKLLIFRASAAAFKSEVDGKRLKDAALKE